MLNRLGAADVVAPISWNVAMLGRNSGIVWVPRETKVLVLRDPESVDLNSAGNITPRKVFARALCTHILLRSAQLKRSTTRESRNLVR